MNFAGCKRKFDVDKYIAYVNKLVGEMIGTDWEEFVRLNATNSEEKWRARMERRSPHIIKGEETANYLKGVPNSWCSILRQQCRVCSKCQRGIANEYHMLVAFHMEPAISVALGTSMLRQRQLAS